MYKIIATCIFVVSLFGCAIPPAPIVKHDAEKESQVRNFQVGPDVAKVYFFGGDRIGGITSDRPHGFRQAFYLNSNVIAKINPTDTLVFDLKPGTYTFGWGLFNSTEIPPNQLTLTVSGGQIVILRGEYNAGAGSSFGLIGALVAGPYTTVVSVDKSAIRNSNYVAVQSCPDSVCVTSAASPSSQTTSITKSITSQPSGAIVQQGSATQKLKELNELLKNGLITQKDYDLKKASILKDM